MSYELTPARQQFLIAVLFAVDERRHNSPVCADKLSGTLRCTERQRPMFEKLAHHQLVEWEYAKIYTERNVYDVRLTEKGYRIAARCLLWSVRGDLTAFPPTLNRSQFTKPV